MSNLVPVFRDDNNQQPIPSEWRRTFYEIVEAFKDGDFGLARRVTGVRPISVENATRISGNINAYGARLISLPEDAWQTSACQWMRGYWDVLVDLFTAEEGASDLALVARVYEQDATYAFEVESVHVP